MHRASVVAIALGSSVCARPPAATAPGGEPVAPASVAARATPPPRTAPEVSPTMTAPQVVTPIDAGLGDGPLLLWPVDVDGSRAVVLFADELSQIRAGVARSLGARGIATIPIDRLEQIERAAATGTLVLEGGLQCLSPLSRAEVHARYFATNPKVSIEAQCFDACRLNVSIARGGDDDTYLSSATVSHPEDPGAWIAAAGRLGDEGYLAGGLGLYGTSHNPPIRFGPPGWVGRWSTAPTAEQFSALEPRAAACAHVDPFVRLTYAIRASVDRRGRVDRCVADGPVPVARDADELCLCEVMRDLRFKPGAAGRRLRVEAIDNAEFTPSAGTLTMMQPGTEVWIERLGDALALERCAASDPLTVSVDATVSLQLAADGAVEDVRIDGDLVDVGVMRWAQCVVGKLRAVPLPCAPPGIDELRARLVFKAR